MPEIDTPQPVAPSQHTREHWASLAVTQPRASALLHVIVASIGSHNAVVASQATLARLAACSVSTLKRSLSILRAENWIEVRQIGPTGTANAYIVNRRLAWRGDRDATRSSVFAAVVVVSAADQPDREKLGTQAPLRAMPSLALGEQPPPRGPGLPPSQAASPGMELEAATAADPMEQLLALEREGEAAPPAHPGKTLADFERELEKAAAEAAQLAKRDS